MRERSPPAGRMLPLVSTLLSACVGFTGGHASVPYFGDTPPAAVTASTPYELGQLSRLSLPGLNLYVRLNNKTLEYVHETVFLIPTRISHPDKPQDSDEKHLSVTLALTPTHSAMYFDPRRVSVTVNGQPREIAAAWLEDAERFRQAMHRQFEADARAADAIRSGAARPGEIKAEPADPADWTDPVTAPVALDPDRGSTRFVLDVDVPVPSTDASITLDLSRALTGVDAPQVPKIHFRQIRWSFSQG